MGTFTYKDKAYEVDDRGFLQNYEKWDEDYAEGMAPEAKVQNGLGENHWQVIRFIRSEFEKNGECPIVYSTCRANNISPRELKALFPAGYTRGACRLAGISYRDRFMDYYGETGKARKATTGGALPAGTDKVYRVDAFGFLVDPDEWDEDFAHNKAREMKLVGGLNERRHEIVQYIRRAHAKSHVVPSVSECCETLGIELDEMERLFPDGYVRGAVKIAGLSMR
ncbi:MAG: TusE/DsrC/DsvC family sulfur relay protein [Gemmatimonadota bacterium]|nr:MAG: TusE/DsrC/DsvC family sulfur relay protein [Gemmatimonadota bacterium]